MVKKKTPQNIVIGGASGALPPVIGWTIANNNLAHRANNVIFNNIFLDTITFLGIKFI